MYTRPPVLPLLGEVIVGDIIEELRFWSTRYFWWSARARDAEAVSDFEYLPLLGDERDDTHLASATWALKGIDLKDTLDAGSPTD